MTELRNLEQELGRFRGRLLAAAAFVLVAFVLLAALWVALRRATRLLVDLNRSRGTTVVTVLHDLNLAARYSDHLVALIESLTVEDADEEEAEQHDEQQGDAEVAAQ